MIIEIYEWERKLWKIVVRAKCWLKGHNWILSKQNDPYVVGLWKFITIGWERFSSRITFEVDNDFLSFLGNTTGVMEFFWGTFSLHSMPLQRIGMCIFGYLDFSLVIWSSVFVRDASQKMIVCLTFSASLMGRISVTPHDMVRCKLNTTGNSPWILLPLHAFPCGQYTIFFLCLWFLVEYHLEVFCSFESIFCCVRSFSK